MSVLPQGNASVSISAVDLFCGVGGLTRGLQDAGIDVIAGIDVDPTCKYAYEGNTDAYFIHKDIREFTSDDLSKLYPSDELSELYPLEGIKLLVGCAPCQPFSFHTKKYKDRHLDEKWNLLDEFGRLIEGVRPHLIVFENVTSIRKEKIYKDFIDNLEWLGYHFDRDPELVYCPDYGVPQKRRRLVLIASIWDKVELKPKTHSCSPEDDDELFPYRTVRQTIEDLPEIGAGEVYAGDRLHRARNLSEKNKKRIKQSIPGGTWQDWDPELRAPCHQVPSGQTYKSVYGRMEWDEPSPTITTQFHNFGCGRFGHPEQHRALSFREAALLQTFPPDYDFVDPNEPVTITNIGAYIGNAVPVELATVIGESIQKHVEENYEQFQ